MAALKDQRAFELQSPRYVADSRRTRATGWLFYQFQRQFSPIGDQLPATVRGRDLTISSSNNTMHTEEGNFMRNSLVRGEIAFTTGRQANGVRMPLLWTVVIIVWFIWKLETAMSWPRCRGERRNKSAIYRVLIPLKEISIYSNEHDCVV